MDYFYICIKRILKHLIIKISKKKKSQNKYNILDG